MTLEQWLRQLNPLAEVSTTRLAQDTPDWLFRSEVFRGSYEQRFRWLGHVLTTRFRWCQSAMAGRIPRQKHA